MRLIQIIFLSILFSCNTKQDAGNSIDKSEKVEISIPQNQKVESSTTEILETFVDSSNIGNKGFCKIELIKHRVYDDNFVIIKFYIKRVNNWYLENTYSYETNAEMDFQPNISDFNNDKFNDITFISGTAARGANEVRRLFIYDDDNQKLISIVNSQDYPNLEFNTLLNCIDAFMIHGGSTTEFARIAGDSLKTFASVENNVDYHIVYTYDKMGNYKELYKVPSKDVYVRHKNYKPLIEYTDK
jgi:hypothetical protein